MTEPAFVVPASLEGERVDRAIALLTGVSRSAVACLVAAGAVRVDGHVVAARHQRLRAGEEVVVEAGAEPARQAVAAPEAVELAVVYEDAALVVVDKPAGLVVHPGAGVRGPTLVSGLLARFPDLAAMARADDADRPGIVHRLDKGTSGLLVVARDARSLAALRSQLARREIGRGYVALAIGSVRDDRGVIEAPIGRSPRNRTRMAVTAEGRPARTSYRVLSRFSEPLAASLLELTLETGRTHQIRVHLSAIGHPIAGDPAYRGRLPEALAAPLELRRPFLHAGRLHLVHPLSGEQMEWTSPLPEDLERVLARFR